MPYKRPATETEIQALAAELSGNWIAGSPIRVWLRAHYPKLVALIAEDWSWAGIAAALNVAEITYQTKTPWTATSLRTDAFRAAKRGAGIRGVDRREKLAMVAATVFPPAVSSSSPSEEKEPFSSLIKTPRKFFSHAEFADPQPVVELTAEELERQERIRRKVFGPEAVPSNQFKVADEPLPRFRPVRIKIHGPPVPKTAEELARIAKIRAEIFGTEE
ncbi:MAG: hypothetical protein B7Z81_10950 [Acidocella sp. 20-61-6]|nr:MAG: hypothetical protein B7Z81_10950 [Acidocella sp. 20-61-6]